MLYYKSSEAIQANNGIYSTRSEVEVCLYTMPISFRTSNSFHMLNGAKISPINPDIFDTPINAEISAMVATFISYTLNAEKPIEFKLLTYEDYELILDTATIDRNFTFYDSLASPTLREACDAGGCQFLLLYVYLLFCKERFFFEPKAFLTNLSIVFS